MIRTGTNTEERPCEDRDTRAASTSQGGRPQRKLKMLTLDLWILSSSTVRKLISVVLSTLLVILDYGNPLKLTQSVVMIVVTVSSKAINGYVWFPVGIFSKGTAVIAYPHEHFSFFLLSPSVLLLWIWKCFDSFVTHHPHTLPLNHNSHYCKSFMLLSSLILTWGFSVCFFCFFFVFLFVVLIWFGG